jgi:hypothetical protein
MRADGSHRSSDGDEGERFAEVKGTISHSSHGGGNQDCGDGRTSIESIIWDIGHITRNGDDRMGSTRRAAATRKIVDGRDVSLI